MSIETTASAGDRTLATVLAMDLTSGTGCLDGGSTATYHALRAGLPGGDRSDTAVVLHVLEELYQHLGHMELTADALTS